MDAALSLGPAVPAPRTRVFTRRHRARAGPAPDAWITLRMQSIEWEVVFVNVGPHLFTLPVRHWVQFYQSVRIIPFHDTGLGPRARLIAADAGDPGALRC